MIIKGSFSIYLHENLCCGYSEWPDISESRWSAWTSKYAVWKAFPGHSLDSQGPKLLQVDSNLSDCAYAKTDQSSLEVGAQQHVSVFDNWATIDSATMTVHLNEPFSPHVEYHFIINLQSNDLLFWKSCGNSRNLLSHSLLDNVLCTQWSLLT